MSFNENVSIETPDVVGGGGGGGGRRGGGMVVGGGIGGLLLLILGLIFGVDLTGMTGPATTTEDQSVTTGVEGQNFAQCKTGADANKYVECRIKGTVASLTTFWNPTITQAGRQFVAPKTVIYSGSEQSACGTASNQVGPFYCPLDQRIYIDASFFDILTQQFGSSNGALAQEYVVAHEYGHHIQNLFGILDKAQQDPKGPQSGAVRVELMADCFGGVWAKHASSTKDASGVTFLKPLTKKDIVDALSAAKSVGDDHIQNMTTGQVNPESWTHGSSEARQRWFLQGYSSGDFQTCDTFAVANPDTAG